MTPPDNTEQRGSGGTDTSTGEVPPWQRVDKDGPAGSPDGDGGATQWLPSQSGQEQARPVAMTAAQPEAGASDPVFGQSGPASGLFGQGSDGDSARTSSPASAQAKSEAGSQSGRSVSAFRRPGRGPRRANLQVKRIDPWSVLKLSLVLGVALFFIWLVAVGVLYMVLDGMGVWDNINGTYNSLVANDGAEGELLVTAGTVFGAAAIVGAVNIVLISALTTVGAFIYNACAGLTGGLELTLSERE
ncbi:DUF3566 domain-containing protein [Saccharomonospora xinjiangensis]|uniref:DUF3566 domain-containing protein n=1 Tax=Saccharomonospora xinjiangensis XJ-54 TaxID=882086 RepID=I0V2F1_9PSEU|nr:DUF3566 domain-containing protein [Saccharomonospora xinjiangensis]EID54304.1 Transmembrane domain of unknown function (DUF3566) [Saccharomonospora xinjiangensis XJ-54]